MYNSTLKAADSLPTHPRAGSAGIGLRNSPGVRLKRCGWNLKSRPACLGKKHLSECKIDACGLGQRVPPILKRSDAVVDEACRTAPHCDVAAFQAQAAYRIGASFAAP